MTFKLLSSADVAAFVGSGLGRRIVTDSSSVENQAWSQYMRPDDPDLSCTFDTYTRDGSCENSVKSSSSSSEHNSILKNGVAKKQKKGKRAVALQKRPACSAKNFLPATLDIRDVATLTSIPLEHAKTRRHAGEKMRGTKGIAVPLPFLCSRRCTPTHQSGL